MAKSARNTNRTASVEEKPRVGRPLKSMRQISVTSNKIIDRALELMVLQGIAKTRETAATQLLNSAANKFIKNSQKFFSQIQLDTLLDGDSN